MVMRVADGLFDIWQPDYANAEVEIVVAGTTDTLATVYTDEALTTPADNPQTLLQYEAAGINYGKFSAPLYTAQAHYLRINSTDETGIFRPAITDLSGEDVSSAEASPGTVARPLDDILADVIWAENYGVFTASASGNTTILTDAIGAASARGGGAVLLPEGTIAFNQISLPARVELVGAGRGVTVLQSQAAGKVVTVTGDAAGLRGLTLDGVNVQSGSVGIYAVGKNELRINDVSVRRFETGIEQRGGARNHWRETYVDTCATGVLWRGDLDTANGSGGAEFRGNSWIGGLVSYCTTTGVELRYVDKKVESNDIEGVGFESNTGTALKVNGARLTRTPGCWYLGNTTDLDIRDGSDTSHADENEVIGFQHVGGYVSGGNSTFTGRCDGVIFDGVDFYNSPTLTLATMRNNIVAIDCVEDSTVTLTGADAVRWLRHSRTLGQRPGATVVTTDATVTPGYRMTMDYGSAAMLRATVVARSRNGTDYAVYHFAQGANRPGSTLAYQTQTANFTVGDIITGATSGAKARVIADSDSGSTGTLTLKDITKEFTNGEVITGATSGSAVVNGTLSHQNAALLGSQTEIQTAVESDSTWAAVFAVSGGEVRVNVTGAASKTIEWSVHVDAVTA